MLSNKSCCFIGHRKIEVTESLKQSLKDTIINLITSHNVLYFLFGSKSEFNNLCYMIVNELKKQYQNIKTVAYTCNSEVCFLERERISWQNIYSHIEGAENQALIFDDEVKLKSQYSSGRTVYIERNKSMINDSDYCVFFYDDLYKPKIKQKSCYLIKCLPNSGTALAYKYACSKKKMIINLHKK